MKGRLVGINTAILSRSGGSNGIGFAIPANLVRSFVDQARAGNVRFQRPWAGVTGQPVDAALAEGFGMDRPQGVVLSALHPQSPFRKAGLEVGDVVLTLDGAPVNSPQEMLFRLSAEGVGQKIEATYLRDGRREQVRLTLISPPEDPPRDPRTLGRRSVLEGLSVVNVNPAVAAEEDLPSESSGVLIVEPGRNGARLGLRPGDILLKINGTPVATTRDVARAAGEERRNWSVEYLREGRRAVVRFRV
ncbi:hypothetical protein CCR78_00730 [Rhodovulum imhoffii]|nr:hypothetical protein [Rhodovulum imhoffii]